MNTFLIIAIPAFFFGTLYLFIARHNKLYNKTLADEKVSDIRKYVLIMQEGPKKDYPLAEQYFTNHIKKQHRGVSLSTYARAGLIRY